MTTAAGVGKGAMQINLGFRDGLTEPGTTEGAVFGSESKTIMKPIDLLRVNTFHCSVGHKERGYLF